MTAVADPSTDYLDQLADLNAPLPGPKLRLQPAHRESILRALHRRFRFADVDDRQLRDLNLMLESMGEPRYRRGSRNWSPHTAMT